MYIRLHLTPSSRREAVNRVNSEFFKINVKEDAKHNLANKRGLELLAHHLNVPKQQLHIIHGHQTPHKLVHIRGSQHLS